MSRVILPGGSSVDLKYDPMGRRIQKASSSGTVNYVYDGANVLEEVDAVGTLVARYTQSLGLDEPLAMLRSGVASYYQADGLGSITSLSNSSGALSRTYAFDSFGKIVSSSGTVINPYGFTGREFDSETGLYYYRARYYDSQIGRFLSEDPIFPSDGFSAYSYVVNNPVNLTDSSGLLPDVVKNALGRHLSDCVQNILKEYFPGMDLSKIRLHEDKSLPWFDISGMTHGNDIHYDPAAVDGSVGGIALLAHEITHSAQYAKTWRPIFYYRYAASYIKNRWHGDSGEAAYRRIPQEVEAYTKQQEIFQDLVDKYGLGAMPCKEICK